ncbi:hypothetical protein AJ80_04792 [Polytolypa hystricis UAMH7299]|uniref:Exocyst complex component EXO84 n=1 Tax=Polytolypa hystricis (strain UAMH7299) TaxID=1447883 RepID=A0A2B7Y979_POLH7|nr:hypothetical protein AJ80_04792 [Polytolypa hystricis UAMH7299]
MDVRGLTLRNKGNRRPKISAPTPISDPNAPASTSSRSPRTGPPPGDNRSQQNGGATSDLVKRRYSTRYNQLPNFDVNAPPIPGLPAGPGSFGASSQDRPPTGREPASDASQPLRVEINALRDPSLSVDKYVTNLLANASEQDIRDYQSSLRKLKNRTSADLQQSVYQNRTQFIKISKEAEKLKGEMSTLRNLMSDLTTALGQANATNGNNNTLSPGFDDAASSSSRRNPNRSSIANLESMWNVQLQTLWKTIERSQKFLPAIPGRHIVMETGHWVELDSATWKPRRPVHIVLLNDHLLVAAKRRKRVDANNSNAKGPVPVKLVAEECWPLQDIDMIDLSANLGVNGATEEAVDRGVPNAINIRYGQKSFTYRHDQRNGSAKHDLLVTFRRTVEDLRKLLRTETESAARPRESILEPNQLLLPRRSQVFENLTATGPSRDKVEVLIDVDGKQQNMRWVDGQLDDLDIAIALQRFEGAVSSVERLRKLAKSIRGNSIVQDLVNFKIDQRASKLAEVLLRELVETHSFPTTTRTKVGWLTRLGFDDHARDAYLNVRSESITKRARQCVFEGNLPLYIFQISYVYFTMIKNTLSIYQQCFPPAQTSACVKWAKHHLDNFNDILVRQLSSVEPDNSVWQKCMDIALEHADMLSEVGVDFRGMVGKGLGSGSGNNGRGGQGSHAVLTAQEG